MSLQILTLTRQNKCHAAYFFTLVSCPVVSWARRGGRCCRWARRRRGASGLLQTDLRGGVAGAGAQDTGAPGRWVPLRLQGTISFLGSPRAGRVASGEGQSFSSCRGGASLLRERRGPQEVNTWGCRETLGSRSGLHGARPPVLGTRGRPARCPVCGAWAGGARALLSQAGA